MREIVRLTALFVVFCLASCTTVKERCLPHPTPAPTWSPDWASLESLGLPGKGCQASQYSVSSNSRVRIKEKNFFVLEESMGSGVIIDSVHIYQCSDGGACYLAASRSSMVWPLRWAVDSKEENFLVWDREGKQILLLPIESMQLRH